MTKSDLLTEFVEAIERARGPINDPLAGRGRQSIKPLAPQGSDHIAFWETANVFKKGQTISNDGSTPTLSLDINGGASDVLRVRNLNTGLVLCTIDQTGFLNTGAGLSLYPGSGSVGTGFYSTMSAASAYTANRSHFFPDVNGTIMIRAYSLDRLNSALASTVTMLTAANAPANEYQINIYLCTGSTAGDRKWKLELLWRDQRADGAAADRVLQLHSSYDISSLTGAPLQYTGTIYSTGTTSLRFRTTLVSGTTGTYDLHVRVNAT